MSCAVSRYIYIIYIYVLHQPSTIIVYYRRTFHLVTTSSTWNMRLILIVLLHLTQGYHRLKGTSAFKIETCLFVHCYVWLQIITRYYTKASPACKAELPHQEWMFGPSTTLQVRTRMSFYFWPFIFCCWLYCTVSLPTNIALDYVQYLL